MYIYTYMYMYIYIHMIWCVSLGVSHLVQISSPDLGNHVCERLDRIVCGGEMQGRASVHVLRQHVPAVADGRSGSGRGVVNPSNVQRAPP